MINRFLRPSLRTLQTISTASFLGLLLLMGCSQKAEQTNSTPSEVVRFSDVGWTDITATTAMASEVLLALGYKPELDVLSVAVTYASLKNGDIDVFLGNWMPAQNEAIGPYVEEGSIEVLGANLEGAKYTLAVPAYAYEAGLKDFEDISRFADKLDGKIYGIEPGNEGNEMILGMIEKNDFDLNGFDLVESSEQGMLTVVERAVEGGDWVVFLGWEPHPMNTSMEIEYLSGGDETFGPDYGGATVYTVSRKGYADANPNVSRLLHNMKFTLGMENEMMELILSEKMKPRDAARQWLSAHPAVLEAWTEGTTTRDGSPAWPAIESAFGLESQPGAEH